MHPLLQSLSGGDRRSIGHVGRAVQAVLAHPQSLAVLFEGVESPDPVLRMRCADAIEKVTARQPHLLTPFKDVLLNRLAAVEQPDVRWHVAPLLARLPLTAAEEDAVVGLLLGYTQDRSSIVKTLAMQALADMALRSRRFLPEVARHIAELSVTGTPAMQARGRKLQKILRQDGPS